MLKLNASFNKKVPAETEYSSKGYSASIELEIPDGLTQEQLQKKIHDTFELVRSSVESEINGTVAKVHEQNPAPVQTPAQPTQNSTGKPTSDTASPQQIKYLSDLARKKKIELSGYLKHYGRAQVTELNRQECSQLIDVIRKQAA